MPWPNPTVTCTVTEVTPSGEVRRCPRPHASRGWCSTHYKRWQRTGDPGGLDPLPRGRPPAAPSIPRPRASTRTCEHPDGCPRPHASRGLCAAHHRRWLRSGGVNGGDPGPVEIGGTAKPVPRQASTAEPCSQAGCANPAATRGMCRAHYIVTFSAELAVDSGRPKCSVPDCPTAVYGHGLCRRHHEAVIRERQRAARVGDERRAADPRARVTTAA